MDAISNSYPLTQYLRSNLKRDLDKAYCGFFGNEEEQEESGHKENEETEQNGKNEVATGILFSSLALVIIHFFRSLGMRCVWRK